MLLSKIVLPVIIGIGIITNILVIVGMSNARMTVSASAKFYYLIIATGDLWTLLSYNWIYTFLNRTLWYWNEKELNINLLTSSSISCKIWVSCWNFFRNPFWLWVGMLFHRATTSCIFPISCKTISKFQIQQIVLLNHGSDIWDDNSFSGNLSSSLAYTIKLEVHMWSII